MKQDSGQRENWVDAARGIGILLVIIGHCRRPELVLKMIQSFHMPFFFLLSGYLFRIRDGHFRDFAKRKAEAYLIPYSKLAGINLAVWMLIMLRQKPLGECRGLLLRYTIGILYSRGTWYWMPNCSPIWFLTALFCASILMYGILKLPERFRIPAVILCAAAAYWCAVSPVMNHPVMTFRNFRYERIKLPLNIDSALWGVPFLYLGYCARERRILQRMDSVPGIGVAAGAAVLLGIGASAGYRNPVEYMSMDSMIFGNAVLSYVSAVGISAGIILAVRNLLPENRLLIFLGRNTIPILGYNYLVNYLVYQLWDRVFGGAQIRHGWAYQCLLQILLLAALAKVLSIFKEKRRKNPAGNRASI